MMSFFRQTKTSKLIGLAVVVVLTVLIGPVYGLVSASDSNHIIDVSISCDVHPNKNPSGFITSWDFSVSGAQVNGPATGVKLHVPWGPFAVEGSGSGTSSSYTYQGSEPPATWSATAETFQLPGWAGSLTQCTFDVPPQETPSPELSVVKTGPASAKAGDEVSYTLAVKNTGSVATTQGFYLTDRVDAALDFIRSSSTECTKATSSRDVVCSHAANVNPGQTITYTLTFKVASAAACGAVIPNKADISVPDGKGGTVTNWSNMTSTTVACTQIPQLVCSPATQTVDINQNANFTATGGTGTYAWTATGGTPANGSASAFSTKYSSAGTKTATVASGTQTANCSVVVRTPPAPKFCKLEITKSANKSTAQNDDTVVYTIAFKNTGDADCTGGGVKVQDVLSQSLTYVSESHSTNVEAGYEGTPVYQSSNRTITWNAHTLTPGQSGSVTVTAKVNDFTPTCSTRVVTNRAQITADQYDNMQTWVYSNTVELTAKSSCPTQLVCSPANQTVNINQAASISATGGNGSYVWSAPGASAQTVSGQTISVTYNNSGSKSVQVTSGSQTATCNVQVNIPLPTTTTLTISKVVRNVTQGGSFAENLSNVRVGDVLEYQLRVRNTGSVAASVVTLRDYLNQPNLLSDFRNMTTSQLFTGSFGNGSVVTFTSDLQPNAEFVVGYLFTVSAQMNGTISACNTATTTANNAASATDTACVTGTPGVPNLVLSKSAYNDTKNVDATTRAASREDYITYTLTVRNTGNSDATNYVFTDNLSGVLPLADMVDLGGGSLVAQTLNYPAVTVPAGGTVSKTFRVRVKYFLSSSISYQMINTFGNTVVIVINPPTPYTPPKTGGMTDVLGGIGFAGLLTSAALLQRKKNILKLIFA